MKTVLKILFLIIFASIPANAVALDSAMQDEINNFKGKQIDTVIKKWGKPSSVKNFNNGYKLYIWDEARQLKKTGSKYISYKNIFITEKNAKKNKAIYRSLREIETDSNNTIVNGSANYLRYSHPNFDTDD